MDAMMRAAIVSVAAGIAQYGAPQAFAIDYKVTNGNQCVPAITSTAEDFRHCPTGMVNITQEDQFVLRAVDVDSEDPPTDGDQWRIGLDYFNSSTEAKWGSCVLYVGAQGRPTGAVTRNGRASSETSTRNLLPICEAVGGVLHAA